MPPHNSSTNSPQPEGLSSRLSAIHANVRSLLRGSSIYSGTAPPSNQSTPKLPGLGFLRRTQQAPDVEQAHYSNAGSPRAFTPSQPPLQHQYPGSPYSPVTIPNTWAGSESGTSHEGHSAQESPMFAAVDPETEQLAHDIRRKKRRRHHQRGGWVRRRNDGRIRHPHAHKRPVKNKAMWCIISGIFLATLLAIYISLALTTPTIGEAVHVPLILAILSVTIFFCHSLIRLCALSLRSSSSHSSHHHHHTHPHPNPHRTRNRNNRSSPGNTHHRIPSPANPAGFAPDRPIRVHLARDEEMAVEGLVDGSGRWDGGVEPEVVRVGRKEMEMVRAPPPAYGVWRCSVRGDPNLLHWQRADRVAAASSSPSSASFSSSSPISPSSPASPLSPGEPGYLHAATYAPAGQMEPEGVTGLAHPRPPSYISDDGVSYVVAAAPRSTVTAPLRPPSGVHPAWRV